MLIIAKTATGHMVDIKDEELAQLAGFYSNYSEGWREFKKEIGTKVEVGKLYTEATQCFTLYKEALDAIKRFNSAASKLQNIISPTKE